MLAALPIAELLVSRAPDAVAWLQALYPPGQPRRLARMSDPGEMKREILRDERTKKVIRNDQGKVIYTGRLVPRDKYEDVYRTPFDRVLLAAHLAGEETYSCTVDKDGVTRLGYIDVDQGGRPALLACLEAAQRRGVIAFAIEAEPAAHSGGHVIAIFADVVPSRNVEYLMRQICIAAGLPEQTEVWPGSNQGVRILFGVHRQTGKRGTLITQAGEVISLDDDLTAGVELVISLPTNSAPDAPPEVEKKARTAPKPLPRVATARPVTGSLIDRFNAEHTIEEMVEHYGGHRTADAWACNCGVQHTHDNNLQMLDRGIVSFSNRCEWAPHYTSGKCTDAFGLYCIVEHDGNRSAAVKALAIQYGVYRAPEPKVYRAAQPEKRYSDEERAVYNAQRREKRHEETRAALAAIAKQVAGLDLVNAVPAGVNPEGHSERAHRLFAYLLDQASNAGVLQVNPTNAQICEAIQICERNIQYAFRELKAAGIGKRHGGRGGLDRPNEAAIWSFYRQPSLGCIARSDAECTLDIYREDLIQDPDLACEPRAQPPARDFADTLDTWEWADAAHGADELNALEQDDQPQAPAEQPPEVEPAPIEPAPPVLLPAEASAPYVQRSGGRWCAYDGTNYTWHGSREAARLAAGLGTPAPLVPNLAQAIELDQAPEDAAGASYIPPAVEPAGRAVYEHSIRPRDVYIRKHAWDDIRMQPLPGDEAPEIEPAPALLDLPEAEPLVHCPPSDPALASEYYKLRGAAKKAKSAAQRRLLDDRADALMDWRPVSERPAPRLGEMGGALTSKSAPIRPPARGSGTATLRPPAGLQLAWEDV